MAEPEGEIEMGPLFPDFIAEEPADELSIVKRASYKLIMGFESDAYLCSLSVKKQIREGQEPSPLIMIAPAQFEGELKDKIAEVR